MKHTAVNISFRYIARIGYCVLAVFFSEILILGSQTAHSQTASIRATANVAEPLGITEFSDRPGRFMFAPPRASAYVFVESSGIHYATTLRANDHGFIAIDYLDHKLRSQSYGQEPSLLTVILTEN